MGIRDVFDFLDKHAGTFFTASQIRDALKGTVQKAVIYRALQKVMCMDEYEKQIDIVDREYKDNSLYMPKTKSIIMYRRIKNGR